jgi:hypothetical protein
MSAYDLAGQKLTETRGVGPADEGDQAELFGAVSP